MPTYSRLTREQRYTIEVMNRNGSHQKEIAAAIGVHASTISRELRRGSEEGKPYSCKDGQKHADSRAWKGYRVSAQTMAMVEDKLREEQWSPEQISQSLKKQGIAVSHETIYLHVYRNKRAGGDLHVHLRHRYKSYRKRASGRERRGSLKDQVMIDQRPKVVDERCRIGDWEMDTVVGRVGGPVLVTMVERFSRYTLAALAPSKESCEVGAAILGAMGEHRDKVLTTTYDNGKEFAFHKLIGEILGAEAYFAHPYHSWERGLNENTNGLLRQYFPKGTDFAKITTDQVAQVVSKLNRRPRKCLDYSTPYEIFHPPPYQLR